MELAIAIAGALALVFGVALTIAQYYQKHSLVVWFTYLTVAAGLLLPALYWQKRVWEADAALNKTKERAELFIERAQILPLQAGKPQRIILSVRNGGKLAAREINVGGANNRFLPKTFVGPLEYERVDLDTRPDLAPNAEADLPSEIPMGITEEIIHQLNEGETLFFHYGKGEYRDDFGGPYPFDFCFMYSPLSPTMMRTCPLRYWPKGGGPTITEKDRPELFIQQVEFETFEVGKPEMISLQFRNRGKTTARNVTIETTFAHQLVPFEGPLVYHTVPADTHFVVGPDAVLSIVSRSPWETTPEHVRSVMERSRLLFHYGRGHYEDDRGNRYPISFCYMFEPTLPRNMVIAPDRYWPKEDPKAEG